MNSQKLFSALITALFPAIPFAQALSQDLSNSEERILSYVVDLDDQDLRFYWKNDDGEILRSFENLITWSSTKSDQVVFAMNGGMYKPDQSPVGLYIENGVELSQIDTLKNGYGNFYLQPNGVFYITNENKGGILETDSFKRANIKFATQSGPMLLTDGKIHPKFNQGSSSRNIRNGVGILPNGELLFAMSKERINFYDFASYFLSKGCKNALYLDGFVSRAYLPEKGRTETDGNFGVIIAEVKKE